MDNAKSRKGFPWTALPKHLQDAVAIHITSGQYEAGGIMADLTGGLNADPRFDPHSPIYKKGGQLEKRIVSHFDDEEGVTYNVRYKSKNPAYADKYGIGDNPAEKISGSSIYHVADMLSEWLPSDIEVVSIQKA